jgi:hypothetical protein
MKQNVFADLPAVLPEELFTSLLQTPGVRIERIVSHGHKSPNGFWYDQPTGEWVVGVRTAQPPLAAGVKPLRSLFPATCGLPCGGPVW